MCYIASDLNRFISSFMLRKNERILFMREKYIHIFSSLMSQSRMLSAVRPSSGYCIYKKGYELCNKHF